ncbi:MAG: aconitate hydratase AcnA [Holophagae bacterium]
MPNNRGIGQVLLQTMAGEVAIHQLEELARLGIADLSDAPISVKILAESVVRNVDGDVITEDDVARIGAWQPEQDRRAEVPFVPSRVLLQDFTGVPAIVDLAALREAAARLGGDPSAVNPLAPCDLVIDHSVQVDYFGTPEALRRNAEREFERNRERYEFLKWGQQAFQNFTVVPPATGIVHQVNLEHLARVVDVRHGVAFPDSLVGTDSHTTMINGIGVLGWGVGGIEAEAAMLGQPVYLLSPEVVGLRVVGRLSEGVTATDLALTIAQLLRQSGVVGQFVEFFGPGLDALSVPDRATVSNMAPEYGATTVLFPVDDASLDYLRVTGVKADMVGLVESYCKTQGLWRVADHQPRFSREIEVDLEKVEPSVAGPKRPQDRIALSAMKEQWRQDVSVVFGKESPGASSTIGSLVDEGGLVAPTGVGQSTAGVDGVEVTIDDISFALRHGSVVIAAITSCTNTSNPSVMIAAGLVARRAAERGLEVPPWVKTSLAPGSRVVTSYLERCGLVDDLEKLGFHVVGYGCTTCIGNSGPLPEPISRAVREHDLVVASVLSGNRNFEGRINPDTRANYLASPPLVVAYALAGTVDIDFKDDPIGFDPGGQSVFLRDLWPDSSEIQGLIADSIDRRQFLDNYRDVLTGSDEWRAVEVDDNETFAWDPASTYIRRPPFFDQVTPEIPEPAPITGARALAVLGDSVTTDHISPAGAIPPDSPAARYLEEHGVERRDFNSFGSRRGNHEVMVRGTFGNIRLRNRLADGREGSVTRHLPSGEVVTIYDAAMRYAREGTPLLVLAGREYGTGSSRDWAAKGTALLGVRAVIASSYERIHRSNLLGMGVLPLQFQDGDEVGSLGLDGTEAFAIDVPADLGPRQSLRVRADGDDGTTASFDVICRLDSPVEVTYWRNGGILNTVLRQMVAGR